MSRQHIRDVFDVILEYAGITDADMYPYQLSVGMSQRLAFSIAVHTKPRILLLDEIFSAGDESFRKKAMYTMDELISSNVTVVMVSHNLERVEELSDRILWMDQGIVQHQGDPKETIAAYRQFCHCSTPNAKHHGSAYKHSSSPPASSSHL
jgi:ABC-type polysaccharide/polyol phosphate transport system ATPase subunit